MKYLTAVIIFLLFISPAQAQEPTPAPGGGNITVDPASLPYHFEPITYTTEPGPLEPLGDIFSGSGFINLAGSVTLTVFSIVDSQNVLGIFVVILLASVVLWRIYKFTTTSTPGGQIDLSVSEIEAGDDPEEYVMERRYSGNPYRVYQTTFRKKG